MGWSKNTVLQTYRGYLTEEGAFIKGRLLEDNGLASPRPSDRWWQNAIAMLKRYSSAGIPDVLVTIRCLGYNVDVLTDQDGYFEVVLPTELLSETGTIPWTRFEVAILPSEPLAATTAPAVGELMNLRDMPEYGVISDIDDTLLVSHSTDFFRKLFLMLRKNAYSRLPFAGAAPFYRALQRGSKGNGHNPFFYISSSEWGLYDLLSDFCTLRQIPKGVFLLRTLPNSFRRYLKEQMGNHQHKFYKIKEVMEAFPHLPFVLIGDSGQHDPEIYQRVVHEFPQRVLTIYIRDVSSEKRTREVVQIAQKLQTKLVPMALVQHTQQAAEHAVQQGLIPPERLAEVRSDSPPKYLKF